MCVWTSVREGEEGWREDEEQGGRMAERKLVFLWNCLCASDEWRGAGGSFTRRHAVLTSELSWRKQEKVEDLPVPAPSKWCFSLTWTHKGLLCGCELGVQASDEGSLCGIKPRGNREGKLFMRTYPSKPQTVTDLQWGGNLLRIFVSVIRSEQRNVCFGLKFVGNTQRKLSLRCWAVWRGLKDRENDVPEGVQTLTGGMWFHSLCLKLWCHRGAQRGHRIKIPDIKELFPEYLTLL